jgi:DNA-binding NtrC family response regulator
MARVIVIDDDLLVGATLEGTLQSLGHQVRLANHGADAMTMIALDKPDVVVTDTLMPAMDGIEVLREVKRRWPELPVIMISGGGRIPGIDLLDAAAQLGAAATFAKPLSFDLLSGTIDSLARKG